MTARRPHLEQIQRWMQSVIMHPGGVAEGVESPAAQEHLDVTLANLEDVIGRSRALASERRLEIYVDAYYERLLECLREEFGATRHATGEELFDALAFGYLQHDPSRSYTLADLGRNLPRYLDESRLHAQAIPADAPAAWTDFVVELATFERLQREAYDAPGTENLAPLDEKRLSGIRPADQGQMRLVVAPCLRLCQAAHPVHEYWLAWRHEQQPGLPEPSPTYLAIHRQDYVLFRQELTSMQYALVASLSGGATLAEAIVTAGGASGGAARLEEEIHHWFTTWMGQGLFVDVVPPGTHRA